MVSRGGAYVALTLWSTFAACSSLSVSERREGAGGAALLQGSPLVADPGSAAALEASDTAHASVFRKVARVLASRGRDEPPLQISALCASFSLDGEACERVERYLGGVAHYQKRAQVRVTGLLKVSTLNELTVGEPAAISLQDTLCASTFDEGGYAGHIGDDLCKAVRYASDVAAGGRKSLGERGMILLYGDGKLFYHRHICFPAIAKVRPVDRADGNQVILDLNHDRHWGELANVHREDEPTLSKMNRLVWRGVSTGWCDKHRERTRMMAVSKYFQASDSRIDVGFSEIVHGDECPDANKYLKRPMSVRGQLRYKFILVVDGNDKASGLQWVLASNSVPFMVEPMWESWLMESSLKPYLHYVPVKPDFSDLSSQIDWAVANVDKVRNIAMAGRRYISGFSKPQTERNIMGAVFTAYFDRVEFVSGTAAADPLTQNCSS